MKPANNYVLLKHDQQTIDKAKREIKKLSKLPLGVGMMDAAILNSYVDEVYKALGLSDANNFTYYINKIKETMPKKVSTKTRSEFTQQWILDNSISICSEYKKGMLTLRALHYQLVSKGMTNDLAHYKKVVNTMIQARWNNDISFDTFSDLDRSIVGTTAYEETIIYDEIDKAKNAINSWMNLYFKHRWENQPVYVEVFIEKKALQGVFSGVCSDWNVALGACKGYPSLTFLNETYLRFKEAEDLGKRLVILYFGDYDASGEDIPRSIKENLTRLGVDIEVKRIALMEHQVKAWKLPHAPTKDTDTRAAKWDGIGQVELDAVPPKQIIKLCEDAISDLFSLDLYDELKEVEKTERAQYRNELKLFVNELKD